MNDLIRGFRAGKELADFLFDIRKSGKKLNRLEDFPELKKEYSEFEQIFYLIGNTGSSLMRKVYFLGFISNPYKTYLGVTNYDSKIRENSLGRLGVSE